MKTSRFATTQAVRETACYRCQRLPGEPCQTPIGSVCPTHRERIRRYRDTIGPVEFMRRHCKDKDKD